MSFSREEALAKVGQQVAMHDDLDDAGNVGMIFSSEIPARTRGCVLTVNLAHRFFNPDGKCEPGDIIYEVVIEWSALNYRSDLFGKTEYELFITESMNSLLVQSFRLKQIPPHSHSHHYTRSESGVEPLEE